MEFIEGLEGIVVARSRMCSIDGQKGVLVYGGYDIRDLAAHANYEETAYLLLHGELPTKEQFDDFNGRLLKARLERHDEIRATVDLCVQQGAAPMEMLRTVVSADAFHEPKKTDNSTEENLEKAVGLIARIPVMIARYVRVRAGQAPVAPDPSLSHAANFLFMLTGEPASERTLRTLDVALVLHADHEMNASTFAARVIASTLSDMHSAMVGAIGALKGPLHGGANEQVVRLLQEVGSLDKVDEVIRAKLANKDLIMGFGHRVYKTYDPRALILKEMARDLATEHDTEWFAMSERIEELVVSDKGLYPNVDFYSASTYHYMGIPTDVFTPIFAMSRIAGWAAHVVEQHAGNRLIRPSSEYIGPGPRSYVAIGQR